MQETFDDIWRSLPAYIEVNDNLYWLTITRNIGGVSVHYITSDNKVHDAERSVFLMPKPNDISNDEPTKALLMFRANYHAYMCKL